VFGHRWQPLDAKIIAVEFDYQFQPYARYVIEVQPDGGEPFRAQVNSSTLGNYEYPAHGNLPVLCDPKRNNVKIDTSRLPTGRQQRRSDQQRLNDALRDPSSHS